jgi:hypothetical protein
VPAVEGLRRNRELEVLHHPRPGDAEALAGLVVRPHAAVLPERSADHGQRLALECAVTERPRQPVDRVLEHSRDAPVVFGRDDERRVGLGGRSPQRHHGFDHVVVVDVLVVERQLTQPVEQLQRHALRSRLHGELGDLTVDRRRAQTPHQNDHLDVRHVHPFICPDGSSHS